MKWNQESATPLPTVEMEEACKMPKCQNLESRIRNTAANGGKQFSTSTDNRNSNAYIENRRLNLNKTLTVNIVYN